MLGLHTIIVSSPFPKCTIAVADGILVYTIVQGQIKAKLGSIFGIYTCEPGEYIYTHLFIFNVNYGKSTK